MVLAGAFAVAACSSDGGGSVEAFREIDDLTDEEQLAATFEDPVFSDEAAAEIEAAQATVNAYALEECGVDLDA